MSQEENLQMFQALMRVPHGDIDVALESHRPLRDKNPLFYAKMATWYQENGSVRDHKVAFIRALFEREEEPYREAAWMLLQDMPFYLVSQVVGKKYPRSLRSAVIHYIANMEESDLAYQILRGAKNLRRLVRRLHIPTTKKRDGSPVVNPNFLVLGKELFTKEPELRSIFKKLGEATTENEVKKLLRRRPRIPAYIAVSALRVRTPEIMRVLIESMTPNELLQSLNSLGRLRVVKPNLGLIRRKIEKAVADRRLNPARVNRIKKSLDAELVPPEIFDDLEFVTREKVKRISKIDKKTVILADASGSMDRSLIAARQLAAMLAMACQEPPYIYTCSVTPMEILPKEWTTTGVENAMNLIVADGGTPLGSGLRIMRSQNREVDTIILISDGGENTPPFFIGEWTQLKKRPHIVLVRVPGERDAITPQLTQATIPHDRIELDVVDQYSLDQIIRFVGRASPFETIMEIMACELPVRPPETKVPEYWQNVHSDPVSK